VLISHFMSWVNPDNIFLTLNEGLCWRELIVNLAHSVPSAVSSLWTNDSCEPVVYTQYGRTVMNAEVQRDSGMLWIYMCVCSNSMCPEQLHCHCIQPTSSLTLTVFSPCSLCVSPSLLGDDRWRSFTADTFRGSIDWVEEWREGERES